MHKFFRRVAPSQTMRGSTHLFMSIMIYMPTFIFLLKFDSEFLYILSAVGLGIALGSLLPDLDAPTSKIMYGRWRYIGRPSRYIVTKPLSKLLGRKLEHRGILHSLRGLLYTSIIFAIVFLVPYIISVYFTSPIFLIWYIWIGILVGFLLHLAEDSFTYYGVKWFYPRDKRLTGTIATNDGSEYYLLKISIVVFGVWPPILFYLLPASLIMVYLSVGITIVLLPILHRMNRRISDSENSRYPLWKLVELYIEDVGGERIKPREIHGPLLKLEYSGEPPKKPHIVPILDLSTKFGLERDWNKKYTVVTTSGLKEDVVLEMRTYEEKKEKRVYYIVQDGTFHAFLKRYL